MQPRTAIHVITRGELAAGPDYDRWHDPDRLAPMTEPKRATLLANPFPIEDDDPVQLIGTLGGEVIGRLDLVAGGIDVDGETVRCLWGSALYVPEQHRHTLMGVSLILKAQGLAASAGAAGPSQLAYPVYQKLKWLDAELPRYVLLRRSRSVVERYLSSPLPRRLATSAADAGLLVHRALVEGARLLLVRGIRAEATTALPPELDEALAQRSEVVRFHRSSDWFRWLVSHTFEDDARNRRGLYVVRAADGSALAYFLVKARFYPEASQRGFRNLHLGSLHDWLVLDERALPFEHLALLAVEALAAWDVDAVEICLPPDHAGARLARFGFRAVGEMHVVVRAAPSSALARPEHARTGSWWVRPGEGDYSFS
jgi:hypothetical protein